MYIRATVLYGLVHSVACLWDLEGTYTINGIATRQQLLLSDKLALGSIIVGYSPILWPSYALYDLQRTLGKSATHVIF